MFQPGKQETGNKEASKKVKRNSNQQVSKPMRLKKMVIRQSMSIVHTAKKGSLMMCTERYGCNASCARVGWCYEECAGADKDKFLCDYCL